VEGLGRDREGTGILIDADGLILTIGYLMVEAYAAEIITNDGRTIPASIVGYDHETGFGLLRTIAPLRIKPFTFGRIADVKEKDVVVVASGGAPAWSFRRSWSASASSSETGNICSTRRSTLRRRIRPGAGPH